MARLLYLVRHGEAKDEAEDPRRPLTERGRADAARVAEFARRAGAEVHQVWHSGRRRAEETAVLLAERLEPQSGVVTVPGLAPGGDVQAMAARLLGEREPLMLVGHLPFLERLAGLLVTGDADRTAVLFEKGSVVCLEEDGPAGHWAVRWAVAPELITEVE